MKLKVLIIDDSDLIRFTTSLLLRHLDIDCAQAESGPEGIQLAQQFNPDAILLDIMMPNMDGWEVLSIIEATPSLKDIPIILFTALEEKLFPPQAQLPNVKCILQKPFRLDELTSALRQALPEAGL